MAHVIDRAESRTGQAGTGRLLFFHGAGGYVDDRPLAEGLAVALGVRLEMPTLPDEDMSNEAWAAPVRALVATVAPGDHVIAHSFGASVLLRVLADGPRVPAPVLLLAMPHWGPDGWDVADYAFTDAEPDAALMLHHCRDDQVVPFTHLAMNAALLPSARVRAHPVGGHQLVGLAEEIARDATAG